MTQIVLANAFIVFPFKRAFEYIECITFLLYFRWRGYIFCVVYIVSFSRDLGLYYDTFLAGSQVFSCSLNLSCRPLSRLLQFVHRWWLQEHYLPSFWREHDCYWSQCDDNVSGCSPPRGWRRNIPISRAIESHQSHLLKYTRMGTRITASEFFLQCCRAWSVSISSWLPETIAEAAPWCTVIYCLVNKWSSF